VAHDVFICHSSQDKLVANAACAKLEEANIRCWIAPRDPLPGRPYAEQIVQAIAQCRIVLLVFSSHVNNARAVLGELELASGREKIILPFRIEDVMPSDNLDFYIRSVHWLDAMAPPMEAHLSELVTLVKRILETIPELVPVIKPARDPVLRDAEPSQAPAPTITISWRAEGAKLVSGGGVVFSYGEIAGQADDEQVEVVDARGEATPVPVSNRVHTAGSISGTVNLPPRALPGSKWRLRITTWAAGGNPVSALSTLLSVEGEQSGPVSPPVPIPWRMPAWLTPRVALGGAAVALIALFVGIVAHGNRPTPPNPVPSFVPFVARTNPPITLPSPQPFVAGVPTRVSATAPAHFVTSYDTIPGVLWHATSCKQMGKDAEVGFKLYNGYTKALYFESGLSQSSFGLKSTNAWIPKRYYLNPNITSISFSRFLTAFTCGADVYLGLRNVRFGTDRGPYVKL
jgi:hypothetical protein